MMSRLVVLVSLWLFPVTARADLVAYKCDGPDKGPVRVIRNGSACQGFETGGKQVLFSRIASGHLIVSKDGRTVVMVEDYLYGRVKDGKSVEAFYDLDVVIDPRVLIVYRDGKRVAAYDLARLVKHLDRVAHSISHVRWVESLPSVIDGDRFTITTVTKRRIVIDTRNGGILEEEDMP